MGLYLGGKLLGARLLHEAVFRRRDCCRSARICRPYSYRNADDTLDQRQVLDSGTSKNMAHRAPNGWRTCSAAGTGTRPNLMAHLGREIWRASEGGR